MKKTRLLTPAQVQACAAHPDMTAVEFALTYLNSRLSNPKCTPAGTCGGSFYQITGIPVRLTIEQMFELQARCLASNWKSVQVVVWQDSTGVSLDPSAVRDWECAYDGVRMKRPEPAMATA